ncbi:MAG: hypothetical protein HDT04_03025 [Bacteroidales bacterium]|nr:hypothetical protein [Bacteroidales bacterium]
MNTFTSALLSKLLSKNLCLIAPGVNALFQQLGYSGRTTYYNIISGKCNRLAEFNSRLKDSLNLSDSDLSAIQTLMERGKEYERLFGDLTITDLLQASISEDFQGDNADELLRTQVNEHDTFFLMLAYFYTRQEYEKLPARAMSYQEKVAMVAKNFEDIICELYPHTDTSLLMSDKSEAHQNLYRTTMWLAGILMHLHDPKRMAGLKPRNLATRNYWTGAQIDIVILTEYRPLTKSFTIYSFDVEREIPGTVFRLYFHNQGRCILERFSGNSSRYVHGRYTVEPQKLCFEWLTEHNPTGLGNHWRSYDVNTSKMLRDFSNTLTDEMLTALELQSRGLKEEESVADVMCSRFSITVIMLSGRRFSIETRTYPLLRKITPYDEVKAFRTVVSGEIFIVWPQWNLSLPLTSFTEW